METQASSKWNKIRFKDFLTLQRGFDLPQQKRVAGPYPIIASTSITDFHNEYKVEPPVVTTGRSGALGEVLWTDQKAWPLNTTLWVKDFKSNVPKFCYYTLKTLDLGKYNAGGAVPTLNRNHLDEIDLLIPDLITQRKIADVLSMYDDLIENNNRRIKILEEIAQKIYTEWFVNFRFPGHEKAKFGKDGLPEGWELKNLGDIADIKWGDTSTTKKSYVDDGYDAYSASGLDGKLDHFDYSQDGIVLSAIGANCGVTWLAKNKWSCIKNTIRILEKDPGVSIEYLFLLTSRPNYWRRRGAAQPFISQTEAKTYTSLRPSSLIMGDFTSLVRPIYNEKYLLQKEIQNLVTVRDLLIPQLVTGKRELK